MSFDYEIPYYWVHVGPPDMPEPGFYEDPMSLLMDGRVPVLEKMWRNIGFNWSGERALVNWSHLTHPGSCEDVGHEETPAQISMRLNIYLPNNAIKVGKEVALLIRGHSNEQNMNGGEQIRQLYIPRCKCTQAERWSSDEWEDDDSPPVDGIFAFEADFQAIRYMDSEAEADTWDKQIEEDANSGSLDALAEKAIADFEAGKYTEL
jgi:hypothetical protein